MNWAWEDVTPCWLAGAGSVISGERGEGGEVWMWSETWHSDVCYNGGAKIKTGGTNIPSSYLPAKLYSLKPIPQMLWTQNDVVSPHTAVHNKAGCSILIIPTSGVEAHPTVMLSSSHQFGGHQDFFPACFTCECSLQSWNHYFTSYPIHTDTQRKFWHERCKKLFNNCSTR